MDKKFEEIIKEAFSQGWNASHECATEYDYDYALKNCLSELQASESNLSLGVVSKSALLDEWNAGYNRGCEDTHAAYEDQK